MRKNPELGADFRVSCPETGNLYSPIGQIRARGNLPLLLQEDLVVELKRSELLDNWRATCALARKRVDHLVLQAGERIHQALNDEELIDEPSIANDTAAFFLLALRQKGVKHPCNIPPCEVLYFHNDNERHVLVS
jgi:hypothetical protein